MILKSFLEFQDDFCLVGWSEVSTRDIWVLTECIPTLTTTNLTCLNDFVVIIVSNTSQEFMINDLLSFHFRRKGSFKIESCNFLYPCVLLVSKKGTIRTLINLIWTKQPDCLSFITFPQTCKVTVM